MFWCAIGGLSAHAYARKHLEREASRPWGSEEMVVNCKGGWVRCEPQLEPPLRRKLAGISLDTDSPRDMAPPALLSRPMLPHTLPPMLQPTLLPVPLTLGPGLPAGVLPGCTDTSPDAAAGSAASPLPSSTSSFRATNLTDRAATTPDGNVAHQHSKMHNQTGL